MMTNDEIMRIAMVQSAEDLGCQVEDFTKNSNVIVPLKLGTNAKNYYKLPIGANFISYGNNIVVGTNAELADLIKEYIDKFEFYHCFETPNLNWLNERLMPKGYKVCFMAEYYLPNVTRIPEVDCKYDLRILEQRDFTDLYLPEWSNALCKDRKQLDVLGIGAYDEGKLIGLAGCSADADMMWQIGVDVLPDYRKQGVATALTSKLALEILNRDKVPFYCSAWSNIRSVRNVVKSGFIPAWVEMTVKPTDIVDELNK
ncbi:Acetyltransferase (GNAT) family protein [Pseudobutyrivibrio sp. YE44]|uniref:GNAT family N-acetyltransferase n=1 Tax=Pseudobutyrivibrio sp. YE44 TaxID=1520802 RepID=UPI000888D984|nr:GNAT family N-acetyltransferase [Pseudobutyrivibrio sp. YE44]SDB50108.1 Acetyltransferase (GNAT) family protein [Pseudobutyrivibrio sp. YE44]